MKLGKAFYDELVIEKKTGQKHLSDGIDTWWLGKGRVLFFLVVLLLAFFTLITRLFHLTVVGGFRYRTLADGNRTREITLHAPRGLLLDRTGLPLVTNEVIYRLNRACEAGSDLKGKSCVETLSQSQVDKLAPADYREIVSLEKDYLRLYKYGSSMAHIVGYTGEISREELEEEYFKIRRYSPGDRIGRFATEAIFESKLRGRNGKQLFEVDSAGKTLRLLGEDKENIGESINLAVDAKLSQVVENAFPHDKNGAVVVSKPDTGEILALYSSPTFDPNIFSRNLSPEEYSQLFESEEKPLFNRVIGGVYPPGSTYKIVTALAALETGTVKPGDMIEDTGVIRSGPITFSNWYFTQYGRKEGNVDLVKALMRSNDIYFYLVGSKTGINNLSGWSRKVGLGRTLGVELPGESAGLVPDPAWKKNQFKSPEDLIDRNYLWYEGDTYNLAIGQGYLQTSPLQVNHWTNLVANDGKLCKPTILKVTDSKTLQRNCSQLALDHNNLDVIKEGMVRACSPGGTGWPLFNFKISSGQVGAEASGSAGLKRNTYVPVACKTGTAEINQQTTDTHAWFTVFAPVREIPPDARAAFPAGSTVLTDKPEISITILVEKGGEGSSVAAPVAKRILEEWFSR